MLKTNQPRIDLGRLKKGETRNFRYTITNDSEQSIRVESLTVGCGNCTIASMEQSVLEPQGTALVFVQFTPNSTGQQVKSVTLHYGEGNRLDLKFTAEVYG
jgi:hypothetical protein